MKLFDVVKSAAPLILAPGSMANTADKKKKNATFSSEDCSSSIGDVQHPTHAALIPTHLNVSALDNTRMNATFGSGDYLGRIMEDDPEQISE